MSERRTRPCPFDEWVSVESSNLAEVKYDPRMGFLWVRFHGRATDGTGEYVYCHVPKFRFRNLVRAESVGGYFNKYIRHRYSTLKGIHDPAPPRRKRK